jgi:hypothetical protein
VGEQRERGAEKEKGRAEQRGGGRTWLSDDRSVAFGRWAERMGVKWQRRELAGIRVGD